MESFKPPSELKFTSANLSENWVKWKQKFDNFMLAAEKVEKDDKIKIAILLNVIGDEGVSVFNTFKFAEGESKEKYDDVMRKFESHCSPQTNEVFDRFKFFSCYQKEGQAIDVYLTELKTLASSCGFGEQETSLLRDRVVLGIRDKSLQERLLRESDLTLKKAVDSIRACEVSKEQMRAISEPRSSEINSVIQKNRKLNYKPTDFKIDCKSCGKKHQKGQCPAYNKLCNLCKKKNHFAAVCTNRIKQPQKVSGFRNRTQKVNEIISSDVDKCLYIDNVLIDVDSVNKSNQKEWYKTITVGGYQVNFKLDTGAQVNILPLSIFENFDLKLKNKLAPTDIVLVSYGNHKLKPKGCIMLACNTDKCHSVLLNFVVVDVKSKPLLGLQACQELQLIQLIDEISLDSKLDVIEKFKIVFEGLGKFPGEPHHIETKKDVTPIINPPRRVPQSLHNELGKTLTDLTNLGIVSPVNSPTDWVSSLVVVEKPNGKLRICLDPRNLNKAIKREHYVIPSADEIISRLEGKQCFSVLDLKEGFWQIALDEASSELCTFNSPFGRYKFNRLPFGICSAPEVFQKKNCKLFGDIQGVEIYFDDLIIAGKTKEEHDKILLKVLERARSNNVKFNRDKFQFRVSEVKYMGLIISKDGIKADPGHVKAINELQKPKCKRDIKRLLGMVNFLSKFLPNVSTVTAPLRQLLKNDVEFQWNHEQENSFVNIKELISSAPVLKVFNPLMPITIQCDSSKDGLGACLLQEGHPVSFASRSLSECEINYAQIEKELLAIVFAFEKFHNLLYGHKVLVESDHKPLTSIVQKPVGKITTRLQRMLLKLLKYDFVIKFVPGSQMYLADTLSRANLKEIGKDDPEMLNMVHSVVKHLSMSENRVSQFKRAIQEDHVLKLAYEYCIKGWPKNISKIPGDLKHYYKLRNDLYTEGELLFLNDKIIVPVGLREEMLKLIHEGHFGIEKCKARAREIMYWPKMPADIELTVSKCEVCDKFRKANVKEPLLSHTIPMRPFQKIGMDILEFRNANYLVIIDYFSKWIEVEKINTKTVTEIKQKLKICFSRYGIPSEIVSDNSPFNSYEFKEFARDWDFDCVFVSPRFPQSNGLAERAVGIVKSIFRKAFEDHKEWVVGLMEYRNTPISGLNLSPAQMLYNRRLKTKLPMYSKLLNPEIFTNLEKKFKIIQNKQKQYYDRGSSKLKILKPGKDILVYNFETKVWEPGKVVSKHKNPRAYIIENKRGELLVRNRKHLRETKSSARILQNYDYDLIVGKSYDCNNENDTVSANQITPDPVDSQTGNIRPSRTVRRPQYLNDYEVY